ncbi:MAG: PIN domain-containing protein [Bacillota bacterium]|nr:PIN domain-containing protein [Bacillota bacterium]
MPILPDPQLVVLDSSALLIYLGDERGADKVQRVLSAATGGRVSVVSPTLCYCEALMVAAPELGPERMDDFRATIEQLPVKALPLDLDAALAIAGARIAWALQLADAAAAVAAQRRDAILLTANPQFTSFERAGGRVYWLGPEERRNELVLFDPLACF